MRRETNRILKCLDDKRISSEAGRIFKAWERLRKGPLQITKILSATEKSIVCLCYSPELGHQIILKRFLWRKSFQSEKDGYIVLKGGPIPDLLFVEESSYVLVIEYIENKEIVGLNDVVQSLAFAHEAAARNLARFGYAVSMPLPSQDEPWRVLTGPSVGDVKREHFISDGDRTILVDLETVSITRPFWFDVLKLWNDRIFPSSSLRNIISGYCSARQLQLSATEKTRLVKYVQKISRENSWFEE